MTTDPAAVEAVAPTPGQGAARARVSPMGEVLRDITRGGVAGLIVGVVLAGIGGRLVMRLAALLVPGSNGARTENGNIIGAITADGTAALILFVGLLFGALVGSLWVVISPWLPVRTRTRVIAAVPIAVALGTLGLVDGSNGDFIILRRDPLVVGSLVLLVALFGPALVLVDRWLDRVLPHPPRGGQAVVAVYGTVTVLGTLLTLVVTLPAYLGSDLVITGAALVLVGIVTFASWWRRVDGQPASVPGMVVAARGGLAVATAVGLLIATREIGGALGMS